MLDRFDKDKYVSYLHSLFKSLEDAVVYTNEPDKFWNPYEAHNTCVVTSYEDSLEANRVQAFYSILSVPFRNEPIVTDNLSNYNAIDKDSMVKVFDKDHWCIPLDSKEFVCDVTKEDLLTVLQKLKCNELWVRVNPEQFWDYSRVQRVVMYPYDESLSEIYEVSDIGYCDMLYETRTVNLSNYTKVWERK